MVMGEGVMGEGVMYSDDCWLCGYIELLIGVSHATENLSFAGRPLRLHFAFIRFIASSARQPSSGDRT